MSLDRNESRFAWDQMTGPRIRISTFCNFKYKIYAFVLNSNANIKCLHVINIKIHKWTVSKRLTCWHCQSHTFSNPFACLLWFSCRSIGENANAHIYIYIYKHNSSNWSKKRKYIHFYDCNHIIDFTCKQFSNLIVKWPVYFSARQQSSLSMWKSICMCVTCYIEIRFVGSFIHSLRTAQMHDNCIRINIIIVHDVFTSFATVYSIRLDICFWTCEEKEQRA